MFDADKEIFPSRIAIVKEEKRKRREKRKPNFHEEHIPKEPEVYYKIPDTIYGIEQMTEEGNWDKKTYARMIMKRSRLIKKLYGPQTARQEMIGYKRGRLPQEIADRIKVKQIYKNLMSIM